MNSQPLAEIIRKVSNREHPKLLLIAGPCQIESLDHARQIAVELLEITQTLPVTLIYKSSFDKANRTSLKGARGIGMEEGLGVLAEIAREFQLPTVTDLHEAAQAATVASVVDLLQIPAFLCRQTDLLIAAGETGKPVMIKKGQFLAPEDMAYAAQKVEHGNPSNPSEVMLCERGSCFGYRDLVVDMRSLIVMRELGYPTIFDATHSVQKMGGAGGSSGGSRQYVKPLALAAVAMGVDGVFIECHQQPETAPSDGASMVPLKEMPQLLKELTQIWEVKRSNN